MMIDTEKEEVFTRILTLAQSLITFFLSLMVLHTDPLILVNRSGLKVAALVEAHLQQVCYYPIIQETLLRTSKIRSCY